jgi:hypothetical protein
LPDLVADLIKVQQAQVFDIAGAYVPTKASVYLRPSVEAEDAFVWDGDEFAIDALNFSSISEATNKLFPSQSFAGYYGHGAMSVVEIDVMEPYSVAEYPIRFISSGTYNVYFRYKTLVAPFDITVYLDGNLVTTINKPFATIGTWNWCNATIDILDEERHILGVSLLQNDSCFDKIVITDTIRTDTGSINYLSPFSTIHAMLYQVGIDYTPTSPLYIHDYKTTLDEIQTDDWYNFDLNFIDISLSVAFPDNKYALVLFASGSTKDKYVVWDLTETDIPSDNPSVTMG